ncbi:MAG: cytochrome c-type biogenesis protein [Candidatus Limnocylindria bacterium]
MTPARIAILIAFAGVLVAVAAAARPAPAGPEERVERIVAELRCPVCQGLSVADSPSASAREMRDLVVQRVTEGRTDEAIREEFRRSYGDWVFLAPPTQGAGTLMWLLPIALVAAGAGLAWGRARSRAEAAEHDPAPADVQALRARVAREEAADL